MIRFVDGIEAEKDYQTACEFDNIYGTINSFLYKIYSVGESGMFWNVYDNSDKLAGTLSFVNDTFTICLNNESCVEELAQFINFWGNFKYIKYNLCKAIDLHKYFESSCKSTNGTVFAFQKYKVNSDICVDICNGINLYDVFCILSECFPESMTDTDFSIFNYDMNYRLRKGESYLYGIKSDEKIASIVEVMCCSQNSAVIGYLATRERYRNKGLASSLLGFVSQKFNDRVCYILAENDTISEFYKKLGFKEYTKWAQLCAV